MLPDIQALSAGQFWFWAIILCLLTLIALYFAFRSLGRARIIEDTPTARIRSAPQGYVELNGEAALMQGEPILSPLTMTPCCWFRFRVERRHDKGWRTVRSGTSDSLFLLRDETGECIIDPEGAEISPNEKNVWYDDLAHPVISPHSVPHSKESGIVMLDIAVKVNNGLGRSHYRYTEESINPGDRLYTIGLFKTFGEMDRMSMREEMIKERLSQWKADHASLLARFDRDGDGKIDFTEWEVARRTAKREVTAEQLKDDQPALHTLSRTDSSRRPFLISSHAEFNLVRRYRYIGFGAMGGFFLSGACALWIFATRYTA